MCPESHVATLSPCLSWFMSCSWAEPVSVFSGRWTVVQFSVLTGKMVAVSLLPPLPPPPPFSFPSFSLAPSDGVGSASSLDTHIEHFRGFYAI